MKNNFLNEKIEMLELDKKIVADLKGANIHLIKDLCPLNRKNLKSINIADNDINKIIIKLQLIGLDLNKKL